MVFRLARRRRGFAVGALALAVLAALLSTTPARAEVEHPRQQWLRDSTAGLFLHWGMFTAPRPHRLRRLGARRHRRRLERRLLGRRGAASCTRRTSCWPPSTAASATRARGRRRSPAAAPPQRDFLGELVAAGKAKGVQVILYMTDDPQWHNEVPGVETLDSAAYSAYKGQQVDLTTRDGFGMFSYDLFFEVMDNYPDLSGFWIDNDNAYWEQQRPLRADPREAPDLAAQQQQRGHADHGHGQQRAEDRHDAGLRLPAGGLHPDAAADRGRLQAADHRRTGGTTAATRRSTTGLTSAGYVTNAGSSIKSLMAETAMVNGKFPPQQENFNNFMADWLPPIWSSLHGTEGGGYMYGGLQPGFWNDGAHGVITRQPTTPRTQYVHVLTKPQRSDLVRLRDNGYRVTGVTDLRTGERIALQPVRRLPDASWASPTGTPTTRCSRSTTAGQQGFYPQSTLKATAPSAGTAPAANLVDGSYPTYWDAKGQLPVSVTLDLGQAPQGDVPRGEPARVVADPRAGVLRPAGGLRADQGLPVSVSDDGKRWRAGADRRDAERRAACSSSTSASSSPATSSWRC